ncbi:MAG: hypothetical protein R2809_14155 [Flavobacteriales bacterium]
MVEEVGILFSFSVNDYNNDGMNDISFSGDMVFFEELTESGQWIESASIKRVPVELIFYYNPQTAHFSSLEDFDRKFGLVR